MEQQWHDVFLHNDTGDAAFHNGAPLLVEALQVIGGVCAIQSATRLGLHLRDAQHSSALDPFGATYTEKHVYQEHADRIAVAGPLLGELRRFFQEQAATMTGEEEESEAMAAVPELDGLLVPTAWAAALCTAAREKEGGEADTAMAHSAVGTDAERTTSAPLLGHPLFSYNSFLHHFDRLSKLVSMGEAFSASEPRVKVLQSLFSLYRAYNGAREDKYHPTFGGGDIKRAPKCDLRRLETCMSAASVVRFVEELRRDRPTYPLYAEEQMEADMLEAITRSNGKGGHGTNSTPPQQPPRPSLRTDISVEEAVRRFFGTDATTSEQVMTEEGLCLRPSYASDSTDHWLSLRCLADSDSNPRAALAGRLLQHVLSTSGGADGQGELLAQLIRPLMQRMLTPGANYDRLELELTVTGTDPAELPRLARWCAQSGLLETCPGVYFRFLIVQEGYATESDAARRTASSSTTAVHFGDILKNIFRPIWQAYKVAATPPSSGGDGSGSEGERVNNRSGIDNTKEMLALLARTTGFSVSLTHAAAVQEMPHRGDPATQFPLPHTTATSSAKLAAAPPDAFFVYHVWRNVQLVNAFLLASGPQAATNEAAAARANALLQRQKSSTTDAPTTHESAKSAANTLPTAPWNFRAAFTFTLHGGANSRTLFGESVLGLLLADAVVNPASAFEWSPLTYLYMLAQRHVILTPSRNRCCGASVKHALNTTAIPLAVQAGLRVSVATLDPLFYDTTNDALCEELMELTKQRGLANADVTEMCLRGVEMSSGCFSWGQRRHLFGYAWPHARARFNQFAATQVSSLRLHHRAYALEHELDLLFAAVHRSAGPSPTATKLSVVGQDESATRAVLYLPPSTATAYCRTSNGSACALQREHDPTLLQSLSGYRSHESLMQYPRILITGPDSDGPSAAAKRLMQALTRREAYQKFVVDPAAVRDRTAFLATSSSTPSSPPNAAAVQPVWVNGVLDINAAHNDKRSHDATATTTVHKTALVGVPARLPLPSWQQFQIDIRALRALASTDATVAKYANKRLGMLESKYKLHVALTNDDEESYCVSVPAAATTAAAAAAEEKTAPRRQHRIIQPIRGDAHNCVKVDVHCHMASGITAKSLLQFMRCKIRDHPDDVVGVDNVTGQPITLVKFFGEVLPQEKRSSMGMMPRPPRPMHEQENKDRQGSDAEETVEGDAAAATAAGVARILGEMPIAALQVHAGKATFHRFDRFNHRFSPMGMSSLRSLFLKTENFMQGRYFAELIRGTFQQNELEGNTFSENRLSIYGRSRTEWDRLSRWFVLHGMSHRTNSWMIQVPRLFHLYQRSGALRSFQEMLTNIFEPLWAASCYPAEHPYLHFFLSHVSGFDSVDNESDREADQTIDVAPAQWTSSENPPFAYYMFYMWSNITTLNRYRAARGFNTFQFRPHAGESGDPDHMADVFYLADGIGHGISLDKRPVLQYLYYLTQIPLAIVPMSNNALFCRYADHPLPQFLYRGLNIAIGTDGALIFHRTEQPLLEEYGTAEALWNLSAADICELATSSVRMSGFPAGRKKAWLGPLYYLRSVAGNDPVRSHVPQTRCAFRYEAYMEEVFYLQSRASCEMSCRAMLTPLEEELSIMDATGISREELLKRRWAGVPILEKKAKAATAAGARRPTATFDSSQL
ncbi:AMP deaminase putativeamp deaminase-like protein [Leptomonas pyrrhocoris]|uniref:AMP deaminase putativeamp deaminase-like protein n=1 Tax=Leptomonas pyrrhocoris TaxID=157538 RepID=A0A0M9FV11_LEPPY|nr:AMP deaminase putativeamp deaminase-like protein [Leptomonas pyrrhocoris]KPA76446.1 AMP deaminase putativeamp deaminase-like protein [Leptomonas pyrrhocoris]|eukprot:XP_015654885.1 AMP deaminase putativeamp deaminase-like protein [Leptomonas pyrrhocoris]